MIGLPHFMHRCQNFGLLPDGELLQVRFIASLLLFFPGNKRLSSITTIFELKIWNFLL